MRQYHRTATATRGDAAGRRRDKAVALAAPLLAAAVAAASPSCWQPETAEQETAYLTRNDAEVYAGLEPHAPTIAELSFGTPATLLDEHRTFARIRTAGGIEGWLPKALLLDTDMQRTLLGLSAAAAAIPSQGRGRARDTLNVHLKPYRWSTTFYQLDKDEAFEILDRMLVDRLPASAATATSPPEPTGTDYWYLVRVPTIDRTGWLIANMAYPDIPIDVLAMAQGHPVVAHLTMGSVRDESLNQTKADWLWLQSSERDQVHDFDLLRVFRWDAQRDRYVVAMQRSGLTGYLPVRVSPSLQTSRGVGLGFTILLEERGELHQRVLAWVDKRMHRIDEEPVPGPALPEPPGGFGRKYQFVPSQ